MLGILANDHDTAFTTDHFALLAHGLHGRSYFHFDEQFELFDSERSRVKEVPGRGTWWYWLRSPRASNSTYFCLVYSNGGADRNGASRAFGVAFGFCL